MSSPVLLATSGKIAAVQGASRIAIVSAADGQGNVFVSGTGGIGGNQEAILQRLTVDEVDNIYFVGEKVYSATPQGVLRWARALDGPFPSGRYTFAQTPLLRSGVAWVAGADGVLYRLDTSSGEILERLPLTTREFDLPIGVGDAVVVPTEISGYVGINTSGQRMFSFSACPRVGNLLASPVALGDVILGGEGRIGTGGITAQVGYGFGHCGEHKFSLPVAQQLVDRSGNIVSLRFVQSGLYALARFDGRTGAALAADKMVGGGDGRLTVLTTTTLDDRIYLLQCYLTPSVQSRTRLLSFQVENLETAPTITEIGSGCPPEEAAVMSTAGVLYVTVGSELVAVQTTSPGPVPDAWSQKGRDSRNSYWLK